MIAGLIFDFDGTLADTMPVHWRAWEQIIAKYGFAFNYARFQTWGGKPAREIMRLLIEEQHLALDPLVVAREKEALYLTSVSDVRPIAPVLEIVYQHRGLLPMAIATGGSRHVVERLLKQLGIRDCFQAVATNEDVSRYKPAPDIFLEAARRINVSPASCRAYEDTDMGLEAIRAAGMEAVDVRELLRARALGT